MTLEEKATSIVRTVAMVALGSIVTLGGAYKLTLETLRYLEFSETFARSGAAWATVAVFFAGFMILVKATPPAETTEPEAQPTWKRQIKPLELNRWYEACRKVDGVYRTSWPVSEKFTGVVRTGTNAYLYIEDEAMPGNTVAFLCPDESKFERPTSAQLPRMGLGIYLLDCDDGYRCCTRSAECWHSEDGEDDYYFDKEKRVAGWLLLPDPEA